MVPMRIHKRRLLGWVLSLTLLLHALALVPERFCTYFLPTEFVHRAAHLAAFFILAFLFCLWLRFQRKFLGFRMSDKNLVMTVVIFAVVIGALNEGIQIFSIDRNLEWIDFECNLLGAFLGMSGFFLFKKTIQICAPASFRRTTLYEGLFSLE